MSTWLTRIRDGAIIALCIAGVVVCLQVRLLVANIDAELAAIAHDTRDSLAGWQAYNAQLLAFVNDPKTAGGLKLLVRSADDVARTVKRVNVTLDSLNAAIKRTDENLNDRVFPAATEAIRKTEVVSEEASAAIRASRTAIEAASNDLHSTAAALDDSLAGIQRVADAAISALEQMRVTVADPAVLGSLRQIETTTLKSAETMANVESMTRRMAKPASLAWRVLKETIVITGRILAP